MDDSSLSQLVPFTVQGRCGVVQEVPGAFTTLVVVQQHNMIQRRGDRAIKLLCSYEAVDQTVSNGFTLLEE